MSLNARGSIDQGDLALGLAHLVRDDQACGVLVFNREQRLIFCSPNIAQLLDLDTAAIVGTTASALPAGIRELVKRTVRSGQSSCETEFLERPGRPKHTLRLTALPLHDLGTNDTLAILVQDLSRARHCEDDIRQLDRLATVGTLAAEMAHEVKNALVAVKTFVDLLLEQNPDAELAGTVRREMGRIDSITAQILKYSRNSTPTLQPTSVHAVIERTLQMMKPKFEGRSITVVSRLAATPDTVQGDENNLEQAILNLLLNAAESMSGDGTISVESDLVTSPDQNSDQFVSPRQMRIVIRDTGAGIPSENMSSLFEPFFTTKTNGTGLGLAITRRIIHEHHGLIKAESEAGQGSAFHIFLPAA